MLAAVKYNGKNTEGLIKEGEIQALVKLIPGCSLTEKHRIEEVLRVLKLAASESEAFKDLLNNLASVTISIPSEELYKSLNIFLRQQGWRNIAILYERSELALDYEAIGETVAYFLANTDKPKLNVILQGSLLRDSDPERIVSRFAVKCHAIIRIAHTLTGLFFLSKVKDMSIIQNGDVAIVIFNPGNNISVSVAMATGMAVGLTYLNLKANNNTISENEDFFCPVAQGVVEFPILPNITLYFGRNQNEFIIPYDYYFFGFSENVTWNDFNVSTASFEEIFVLHSVLLWPRTSLVDVARKVWPGGGCGPESDHCLQTPCNSFDTNHGELFTILFGIALPAAFVLFIHIFYHTDVDYVDHIARIMVEYSVELEAEVERMTKDLQEEKQKTEALINSMLPRYLFLLA
ncbi:unnamed protein product [Dibothriocephalus latus]|uniref:Uncharacterized protein n=1 Tax=Dibothriocephalus latus TaxID=60516 RepID=A0A3P6V0F1_DIBLA|nr:unnamed protein product [Dibothriocephalus latus]